MAKGVSDEAVKRATGKDWKEWFAIMDKLGARKMDHKQIAGMIHGKFQPGLSGWWSQMITVEYEVARGMRAKGERPSGKYSISKSATIEASMKDVYAAWNDPARRAEFAKGVRFEPRSVRPPDVVRLNLPSDGSYIEVRITPRGGTRCAVVVQQEGIPDARKAEKWREAWAKALARLKGTLES
jgi:hypothetical protein